ncbi:murein L,D-transpeptidase catalytic domain family protein [Echinicola jeungdonensis]|uniref:Murein L,D-transpeptidase catalytic domain family protein n=1 Tax=Echinicola jeungdonensis TaxID=709343 RepID=A0ABV5J6G3_9BACT|nr:murein L,D-transpeptidase catalytic domain family protein [Echinicola jeungdonensis]MDN3669794.1 murein L,D-transpeptidase catalytic domain family protein [Echinicola jeungdonensis]
MLKKISLICCVLVGLVHSSKTRPTYENFENNKDMGSPAEVLEAAISSHFTSNSNSAPSLEAIKIATQGYFQLIKSGKIEEGKPLTIIDFSLPSTQKRLWTINPINGNILHHSWVAHGKNSGGLMANHFSNKMSSHMSSLGFYLTAETYRGKHGYSLRLDGLEKGINDKARPRAIVIHGAAYANPSFIQKTGRLGRSWGCPALPMDNYKSIIDSIKGKSCLFIYAKNKQYKKTSRFYFLEDSTS